MENRKLIDYLPGFMQEYAEMRELMDAQQPDADAFNDGVSRVWANQFISDADDYGVNRWEKMLGITPKATDTLDERKFRILSWWTSELPYTSRKLEEHLSELCGVDNYKVTIDNKNYRITIKLGLSNQTNYDDVVEMVERIVPANMERYVQIMFNSHNVWAVYTHEQMATRTHELLRTEV